MSDVISQRLVRMVFDNKKFEKGIEESSKSIEKFDKDLDKFFDGNHDAGQLENAIDRIAEAADDAGQHFNLLDAAGTAALLSLAKTAGSVASEIAGKLTKFTIDFEMGNAVQGMNKYESMIESTQKIVNSTRQTINGQLESQESAMARVTPVMEQFQKYADETSYSMGQMTNALGQFTGAGIELEKSSKAIMGIANWAALSGVSASSQDASRAFYNMSQAMGRGAMLYEDWKTFQMIGMGTPEFKKMAIETAVEMKKLEKVSDGVWKVVGDNSKKGATVTVENFTEALSKKWLDNNVLTELLGKYGSGFWDSAGKQIYDDTIGSRSFAAAQEAKTWKDAIEAVYETASTGWSQTWTYVYGNYVEAKKLWTNLANALINVVSVVRDIRNGVAKIFHDMGGQQWLVDMSEKLEKVTEQFYDFSTAVAAALGLIPEESKEAAKVAEQSFDELSAMAKKNSGEVRGMIDTGTIKMKPETKETFNQLADAWDDLDKYVTQGNVDIEVVAEKLKEIERLTDKASKTNGLQKNKKKSLLDMIGYTGDMKKAVEDAEKLKDVKKTAEEAGEIEEEAVNPKALSLADRIRPILENLKAGKGIIDAFVTAGKENWGKFTNLLSVIGDRFLTLAANVTSVIPRLSEFLNQNNFLSKAVGYVLDRVTQLYGSFTKLKNIISLFKTNAIAGVFDFLNSDELKEFIQDHKLLWEALKSVIDVVNEIIDLSIADILDKINSAAVRVRDSVSGFLKALTKNENVNAALTKLMYVLVDIHNFFVDIRNDIRDNGFFPTLIKYSVKAKEAIDNFVDESRKNILNFLLNPKEKLKTWGEGLQNGLIKGLSGIFSPGGALSKGSGLLSEKLNGLSTYFENMKNKYKTEPEIFKFFSSAKIKVDALNKKLSDFKGLIENDVVAQKVSQGLETFRTRFSQLKTTIVNFINDPKASFSKIGENLKNGLVSAFTNNGFVSKGLEIFKTKLVQAQTYFESMKEKLKENPTAIKIFDWVSTKIDWLLKKIEELKATIDSGKFMSGLTEKVGAFTGKLEDLGALKAFEFIKQKLGSLKTIIQDFMSSVDWYSAFSNNPFESLKNALTAGVAKIFPNLFDAITSSETPEGALNGLTAKVTRYHLKSLGEIAETIRSFIAEKFNITNLFGGIGEGTDKGPGFADRILSFLGMGGSEEKSAISDIERGIGDVFAKILGIQSAAAEEISDFDNSGLDIQNPKKSFFASLGDYLGAGLKNLGDGFSKFKPIMDAASTASMFMGIKSMMSDLAIITGKKKEGTTLNNVAKILMNLALAIGSFAAAVLVLSLVPVDTLRSNLITIGVFVAALAGFAVIAKVLKTENIGAMMQGIGVGILSIALSILALTAAIAILSAMKWSTFMDGLRKVATLMIGLGIALWALSSAVNVTPIDNNGTSNVSVIGESMLNLARAMDVLLLSVVTLGALPFNMLVKGMVSTGILLVGLSTALIAISRLAKGKNLEQSAKAIENVGKAIQAITLAVVILGNMSSESLLKGGLAVAGMFIGLIATLKVADKLSKDFNPIALILVAGSIAGMALAFAGAMKLVEHMSWQQMTAFAGGFTAAIIGLAAAMKIVSTIPAAGAISGGIGVAAITGIITAVTAIAGAIDRLTKGKFIETLDRGGDVLEKVGNAIGKTIGGIVGGVGEGISDSLPSIASNLSSFAFIAEPFFTMLSSFNPESAGGFTKFLTDLGGVLIGAKLFDIGPTLGDLAGRFAIWAELTSGLSSAVPDSKAAEELSKHISNVVENIGGKDGGKIANVALAGLWMGRMGAALKLYAENIQGLPEMTAEETLGRAEQVALFVQYIIDNVDGSGFATTISEFPDESSIGVFALDLLALTAAIRDFATASEEVNGKTQAGTELLDYFATLQKDKLPSVGGVMTWFNGRKQTLADFASNIMQLTGAMGTFVTECNNINNPDKLETAKGLLDYFAKDLEPSLTAMTSVWGRIFGTGTILNGGNVGEYQQTLGDFGTNIGKLGAGFNTFIRAINGGENGDKGIDADKIKIATDALGALQLIENALPTTGGLYQLISGGKSLSTFGKELPDVGEGLHGLFAAFKIEDGSYDVPGEDDIGRITSSLDALSAINTALSKDNEGFSAMERLLGLDNLGNLGDFSATLPNVGKNIVAFGEGFKDLPEGTEAAAQEAARIVGSFSTAAKEMPEDSATGIERLMGLSELTNLADFSATFPYIGTNIIAFAKGFENLPDGAEQSAITAANIVSSFSTAAKEIPEDSTTGLQRLLGLSDLTNLADFSATFPYIGKNIIAFSKGFAGQNVSAADAETAASVLKSFSEAAKGLPPETKSTLENFLGISSLGDLGKFSNNLPNVASNIIAFATKFKGETIDDKTVESAGKMIGVFSEIAKALPTNQNVLSKFFSGDQTLSGFSGQFRAVGEDLKQFNTKISSFDFSSAHAAIGVLNGFANLATTLAGTDNYASGLDNLNTFMWELMDNTNTMEALTQFAAKLVAGISDQIVTEENKTQFRSALASLMTIDPNTAMDSMPTMPIGIRPVLTEFDTTAFDSMVGNTAMNAALSSAITTAISSEDLGLAGMGTTLNTISTNLSNFQSQYIAGTNMLNGSIGTVNDSVAGLHDALSFTVTLDGQQLAVTIAPMVDKILGKGV